MNFRITTAAVFASVAILGGLMGCAGQQNGAARIPSGGNDCFFANSINNWKALDDQRLIVWSPGRNCPYLVELAHSCIGIRFTEDIGFHDRDGQICPYGGDAVIVPGPSGDRCSIASITRLSPDELGSLLENEELVADTEDPSGECSSASADQNGAAITSADIGEPEQWGAAKNVVGIKHLYLSEQPDEQTLKLAREHGVGVVINFRESAELNWDEAKAATDLGLTYYNIPISRAGDSFDAETFAQIGELVGKHRDTKILMHCSSGNRAAAWFAAHLVNDHGMAIEPSIDLAKSAGLTSPPVETRLRAYLGQDDGIGN